jgi:two-component system OmpR family response regulator
MLTSMTEVSEQPAPLRRADGSPVRVLVVDDESMLSDLLAMALRYEGWDVRTAGDGLGAVRTAREFTPDAVVLDIMLPDLDGLGSELAVGDLVLDEDSHEARRGRTDVELTATEFELLRFLMRKPRRVLSKAQILDRAWHYDFGGQSNVVELYVSHLRKKIDAGRAPMIHTVRGAGYVLKPAAAG